jgi:hypothetical protein
MGFFVIADINQILRDKRALFLALVIFSAITTVLPSYVWAQAPEPVVAIHISELTQALETIPAMGLTPTGPGTTGNEWWVKNWHYFVMPESLKVVLRSDGTPFVVVSDADIAAGNLLNPDGSPRFPILISLASEAIDNNEIAPLRDYVAAGGFLFVGSSAFTRHPDGTSRGDFALAGEMGLHVANPIFQNWYKNLHFTKVVDHRLVTNIPAGTISWRMPLSSEEIPQGVSPNHFIHGYHDVFQVSANSDTTVIANGDTGPLLATKPYGKGTFVYHGAMQPLIGHTVYDPAMYAYLIYRGVIEWAFETFNLPIIKLSPWRYDYDAAFIVRHDFENFAPSIGAIESSASFENSVGAKGDYYFCTGTLREEMPDRDNVVYSLRQAVTNYGATIGSHNGGLKNPGNLSLSIGDFDYWHWGPDEVLDTNPPGYASGKAYAKESISLSFQDIEGWLDGVDNGRAGCGSAGNCPRTWAAPYFNATREGSFQILEELGAVTFSRGEQKIGPFPHLTLSYEVPGKRYSHISLPASDWYVGSEIPGALEWGYTTDSMRSAVDFYYNLGSLINLYGHIASDDTTLMGQYVQYCVAKPRMWATNSVGIADWWQARSNAVVTPAYSMIGDTAIAQATITGASDPGTAVEVVIPPLNNFQVFIDGAPANLADYRIVGNAIKILVGSTTSSATVEYAIGNPVPATTGLSPAIAVAGGAAFTLTVNGSGFINGSAVQWNGASRSTTYVSATRLTAAITADDIATAGTASVTVFNFAPGGGPSNAQTFAINNVLFSDDFTRPLGSPDPLSPWVASMGTWTVAGGVMQGTGNPLQYSYAYVSGTAQWTDYVVQGRIQIPAGAFGGGLGGRVNPATGAHYGAWVYPAGSPGGSNLLKLWKFRGWTDLGAGVQMQQVSLPVVGTGWHTLQVSFIGNRILVYYDGTLRIDVTDNNYDARAPYLSGGISADWWTWSPPYTITVDDISVLIPTAPGAPIPVTSSLSPASTTAGGAAFTLTVNGSSFVNGSTVQWNGTSRSTTYVSATQLTAAITAADIATTGSASVTVFTPAPGGGTSNAQTFTISSPTNPVPATTGLSPASTTAGGAAFTLTINGSSFVNGSTVQWNGTSRSTTYVSATQLTAAITAADIATAGSASVTVFTPAPGGGTSNAQTFTISSVLFSDDFIRPEGSPDPLSPWVASMGTWTVAGGVMQGTGNPLQYSYAYVSGTPQWTDYRVQGRIQIPAGAFGGGLGGRVDPATGAHYGAWVYPTGSPGGSNLLKLWKFRGWTDIGAGVPMQQVSLPVVGTGRHTLQMSFIGNRILVYYDGTLSIDVTDNNYDDRAPYLSGGISADWWTWSLPYTITVDDISAVVQ